MSSLMVQYFYYYYLQILYYTQHSIDTRKEKKKEITKLD